MAAGEGLAGQLADARATLSRGAGVFAALGLAFWLYYAFLRQVAGPLGPDETYFAHTLWLVAQGKRQYLDFYNHHLPTYFHLLKPLVHALSDSPADLSYVWGVRAISGLVILAYLGLAAGLHRAAAPETGRAGLAAGCALLLVFVVQARMVEVRSDTFGLLLVNAAWVIALGALTARRMVVAAFLAGLALLFAVRSAAMVGVLGLCLLYIAHRSRNGAAFRALLALAAGFVGAGLLAYLAAPDWVTTVLRSCILEPTKLQGLLPLAYRFLLPDRLVLVVPVAAGLLAGVWMMRRGQGDRGLIVTAACAVQLLILVFDPNPFQYVYGWAAVPAVFGVLHASRSAAAYFPFALAVLVMTLSANYTVRFKQLPPTGSAYRLTLDAALDQGELDRMSTPDLVALMISDRRQNNLGSQLRLRSQVCRRLQGAVVSTWDPHPICLHDVLYDNGGVRWPALLQGEAPRPHAVAASEFEGPFMRARPKAFIWAHRWERAPLALLPATRQMLACCYDVYDGFAIAKEVPPGK